MSTVLFIDGENFKKKCQDILKPQGSSMDIQWEFFDFNNLFKSVLSNLNPARRIFYAAKLTKHPLTPEKSDLLINQQRMLKKHLENQGFEFVISGRVRGFETRDDFSNRTMLTFKEKGVDVKIAVDLTAMACDKILTRAIIASSDSDLQPAIKELTKRGVDRIYLGFESAPNKGLSYTTNRTILIRDSEVLNNYKPTLQALGL